MEEPGVEPTQITDEPQAVVMQPEAAVLKPKKSKSRLLIVCAIILLLVVAGGAAYVLLNPKKAKNAAVSNVPPEITFYYNDGKTVIYTNSNPADEAKTTDGKTPPSFLQGAYLELIKQYGNNFYKQGKWEVVTTIDQKLQDSAQKYVNDQEADLKKYGGENAGFVAEDVDTGKVVAWVENYTDTTTESVVSHLVEPGSSIKPFVYATLFDKTTNFGAGSQIDDSQGPLKDYPCTVTTPVNQSNCLSDYDRRYPGAMSVRMALGSSRNVPVVKASDIVGIKTIQDTLKKMGVTSGYKCYSQPTSDKAQECYSAAAIGDGAYIKPSEEVSAYATLSRNGSYIPSTLFDKVNLNGTVKQQWSAPKGQQVISKDAAYITSDILADPSVNYLASADKTAFTATGFPVSLAFGVANDFSSASLFGYTTKYAAGFVVGFDSTKLVKSGYEKSTAPVVSGWLTDASTGLKVTERPVPTGLQALPAYINTNKLFISNIVPSPSTDLYPSYYKP